MQKSITKNNFGDKKIILDALVRIVKNESLVLRNERFQLLAGIKEEELPNEYYIGVSFNIPKNRKVLLEFNRYSKFKSSSRVYRYDPADEQIPVKAHYHIYQAGSKKEVYSVNVDGTAHHRKNKSYKIPKKEAAELRSYGVKINSNNVLECTVISGATNNDIYMLHILIIK